MKISSYEDGSVVDIFGSDILPEVKDALFEEFQEIVADLEFDLSIDTEMIEKVESNHFGRYRAEFHSKVYIPPWIGTHFKIEFFFKLKLEA